MRVLLGIFLLFTIKSYSALPPKVLKHKCQQLVDEKHYSSVSSCIRNSLRLQQRNNYESTASNKKKLSRLGTTKNTNDSKITLAPTQKATVVFNLPVTYNRKVQKWIYYFQHNGRTWFKRWLERSHRYMPKIQKELEEQQLPTDLAYLSMIESGFSSRATSSANAVGPWQFIEPTALRFGLKIDHWIDERRDFDKSTEAATKYLRFLYKEFNSWYLVAAAYNTGEGRIRRLIKRHKTKNFWKLAQKKGLVDETKNYIPKLIAAMLISKAPSLYGFRDLNPQKPLQYEYFNAPGGTNLNLLADRIGVTRKSLHLLNPELVKNIIPTSVKYHRIRIPKGSLAMVKNYIAKN